MLTLFAFLAPYAVAVVAHPLLARPGPFAGITLVAACLLIFWAPWLITADAPMLRLIAAISAAMLALKVIDVAVDLRLGHKVTLKSHLEFLANPFTHVRRSLALERRPPFDENLLNLVKGSVGCGLGVVLLMRLFNVDWSSSHFLVEHISKVVVLMVAIACGLNAAAAAWRLSGGTARSFMDAPLCARTPADFWRRYNRNVQQFFWQHVFKGGGGRHSPARTMLLVFALSALLHEVIFFAAVGRVQGYQTAFFTLQGLAAAMTARVRVRGWFVLPWMAGTLVFNALTSVLFFASIHSVLPFYSQELPQWLRGW